MTESNIGFPSGELTLSGTFLRPNGRAGPAPVILIVPGSGPTDRDGRNLLVTGMPAIYAAWAEHFAARGIASLRYDKRFLTCKDMDPLKLTQTDQIADIVAALVYLQTRPDIDAKRIFILGHSEGGSLAPLAAQQSKRVAGVILVNAPLIRIDRLFLDQLATNPAVSRSIIEQTKAAFAMLHAGSFPEGAQIWGAGAAYWTQWIKITDEAATTVAGLSLPVLMIQGMADERYPGTNLEAQLELQRQLSEAHPQICSKIYPDTDHLLLQSGTGKLAAAALDDMADWVTEISRAHHF